MNAWAELETPLDEKPLFPVEDPDGDKGTSEIERQIAFRKLMAVSRPRS